MNVYENVAFAQQITQVPESRIRRNVPAILSRVGLAGRYKAKPRQLSGGEQQRIVIARAILNTPEIILADEPTGNLDPDMSDEISQVFEQLHKSGKTIILITHDKSVASRAQHSVVIENGTLCYI